MSRDSTPSYQFLKLLKTLHKKSCQQILNGFFTLSTCALCIPFVVSARLMLMQLPDFVVLKEFSHFTKSFKYFKRMEF